jgi:hypothetical protein
MELAPLHGLGLLLMHSDSCWVHFVCGEKVDVKHVSPSWLTTKWPCLWYSVINVGESTQRECIEYKEARTVT